MKGKLSPLAAICILAYSIWNSASLAWAWQTAPMEHYSWLILLIWTFPVLVHLFGPSSKGLSFSEGNFVLLVLSLAAGMLGRMGSLNALCYVGLALAIAAFLPWTFYQIPWILTSAAWMPAMGWLLSHLIVNFSLPLQDITRMIMAFLGAVWMIAIGKLSDRKAR